jgi:hypothetical protein
VADFGRGIKAGVITGVVYAAISAILTFTLVGYQYLYTSGFWDAAGLVPLYEPIVRGIIFGAVFATLYNSLPGTTSVEKGVVLSLFFWIFTVIEVTYTTLSWPWQATGILSILNIGTYYGGTINLSSVSLALISIMSALVFGTLTGFLWNKFRAKKLAEERRGSAVLLVSFILGGITWTVVGMLWVLNLVIRGAPLVRVFFFSWDSMLRVLVAFIGLLGWVLALTAWKKTRRGESGFKWGVVGGVIMALTGFMLLPGALAITGGVLSGRKTASEFTTAEAIARDKIARAGEQKMRTSINRNLILLITSMTMLIITIIVECTTPTPTATYTPITLDQYSSTVISRYGLSLTLSLNSTTYHPGDQISVTIDEKNTLAIKNNIHGADAWPVQGLTLSPCGTLYYSFGISILQGYYDAKSAVAIAPLQLFDPNAMYSCPAMLAAAYYDFDFQPWSDVADIYTMHDLWPSFSISMTTNVTLAGFWSGSCCNATFSNFTPGIYTVIGGDEWGALVILHFTIS